jgi:hypothetical protein
VSAQAETANALLQSEAQVKEKMVVRIRELEDEAAAYKATGIDRDVLQDMWQESSYKYEEERRAKVELEDQVAAVLQSLRASHQIELSAFGQQVEAAVSQVDAIRSEMVDHLHGMSQDVVHKERLHTQILSRTLNQHQVALAQSRVECATLQARIEELESEMQALREETDELIAVSGRAREESRVKSDEAKDLVVKCEQLHKVSEALIVERDSISADYEQLWQEAQARSDEVDTLRARCEKLEQENEASRIKIAHLDQKLEDVKAQRAREVEELKEQLETARSEVCNLRLKVLSVEENASEQQALRVRR